MPPKIRDNAHGKCPLNQAFETPKSRSFTDKIYIFAGYDGNNRVNDFWQYDTEHEARFSRGWGETGHQMLPLARRGRWWMQPLAIRQRHGIVRGAKRDRGGGNPGVSQLVYTRNNYFS